MIAEHLREIRERIATASARAGRAPEEVQLCAISKRIALPAIEEAYRAGQRVFGENYVQEALEKFDTLPDEIALHLTGPLQRNKVKQCVGRFTLIQTADRAALVERLAACAVTKGVVQEILLQVNIAGDDQKSGVNAEQASELCGAILERSSLRLKGLMTIGVMLEDQNQSEKVRRAEFSALRTLRDRLESEYAVPLVELSMGMSSDFEWAVEEGATIVRVGTSIFGKRS
jgi:pyridoxal phosphate enzyme (YggS family)